MPRKKSLRVEKKQAEKSLSALERLNIGESYTSLFLGAFAVVVFAIVLFFIINGKRVQNIQLNNETRAKLQQQLDQQMRQQATVSPSLQATPQLKGKNYKVREGDNLWDIAVSVYGDGFRWPEIARLNNLPNPDLIYPDQVLKLPN